MKEHQYIQFIIPLVQETRDIQSPYHLHGHNHYNQQDEFLKQVFFILDKIIQNKDINEGNLWDSLIGLSLQWMKDPFL